jgi:hypothetical protein
MAVTLDTVQGDMEVYGSDGGRIGNVGGVERATDVTVVGDGPDAAISSVIRYLKVKRAGFLDIVGEDLYVPESAIRSMSFAHGVILECTKDECIERYKDKPNVL